MSMVFFFLSLSSFLYFFPSRNQVVKCLLFSLFCHVPFTFYLLSFFLITFPSFPYFLFSDSSKVLHLSFLTSLIFFFFLPILLLPFCHSQFFFTFIVFSLLSLRFHYFISPYSFLFHYDSFFLGHLFCLISS